jgi:CheY-like chemotaxis protein
VYGIVEQSGGHIRVESVPGQGATFRVYLPRCSGPQGGSDQHTAVSPNTGTSLVLVVEDEETLREAVCKQLRGQGFRVLSAADGVEAMELLEQHVDVAMLITDLVMPRMCGRELVRLASRAMPQLRILVLSGYAEQSLSNEDCNGCPMEFLQKPFSLRTLISRIGALNRRSPVVSQA